MATGGGAVITTAAIAGTNPIAVCRTHVPPMRPPGTRRSPVNPRERADDEESAGSTMNDPVTGITTTGQRG